MIFSQLQQAVWHRRRDRRSSPKLGEHAAKVKAIVEAEAVFSEMAGNVPLAKLMAAPVKRVFDVAEHRVHPAKGGVIQQLQTPAHGEAQMVASGALNRSKAFEAVRDDQTSRPQVALSPSTYLFGFETRNDRHAHGYRVSNFVQSNCRYKRCLACRPSSSFATASFAAPVGVVELNNAVQRMPIIRFFHRLQQFVLHHPGRVVVDAKLAMQLHGRQTGLGDRQQMKRQEPGGQRQLGAGENAATDQRALAAATVALKDAGTMVKAAKGRIGAVFTDEALGITPLKESFLAQLFRAVLLQKTVYAQTLLILNFVLGHGRALRPETVCAYSIGVAA